MAIDPSAPVLIGVATYQGRRYYLRQRALRFGARMVLLCTGDGETSIWVAEAGATLKLWSRAYSLNELRAKKGT